MTTSENILLVEDDQDDQTFFVTALADMGSKRLCEIARNGKEAIQRLKNALVLPSVIFMDVNMPLMDGIECLKTIKKDPRTKDIPVCMLSTSIKEMKKAIAIGAKSYIVKPDNLKMLCKELEKILSEKADGISSLNSPFVIKRLPSNL